MSNPANRLANYRSYSYYHVLAICNSTETAHALATSFDSGAWKHADGNNRYARKRVNNNDDLLYTILIDGSTDASFVITSAKWSAATAASATPQDRATSIAVEGSMQISEPKGVVFLDQIVASCIELGIDAQTAVFALKTFFVGYGYDELAGEYVDTISDIPPLQFRAYDVTATFTEQGGMYEIQFVAQTGGAARMPQFSKIPVSVNFKAESTLGATFKKLEEHINKLYDPYFKCVESQVTESMKKANQDPGPVVQSLQRVEYKITWDPAYDNYAVTDGTQQSKTSHECGAPANL
jgi:hypothetical protein